MEKKFYNVYYSNVNVEENDEENVVSGYKTHQYDWSMLYAYFVKEYKQEARYREKEISDRRGTKKIREEYFVTVGSGELKTYVEEIDGKYYDIITGIEAIQEVDSKSYDTIYNGEIVQQTDVYDWKDVEKKGERYYYKGNELDKNNVESQELKFNAKKSISVEEVYNFLKNLTDEDIELYCQRMKQALTNIPKVQAQRMSKVSQTANEKRAKEDFVSNFRENYGFGRNRTR